MSTVDIAMATYNGEKYISEQIDSIINQSYQNWKLYISDDGSTDDTVKILKTFVSKDNRIILINTERQGGVIPNFNKALEYTNAEFVSLSDQDDIWPVDRLEILVNEISKNNEISQPQLIFTDLTLVNQDGKVIAESFYEENSLDPLENLHGYNLLWKSTVYGCTTIMNRALLNIVLPIPIDAQMHDQWLAMKAHQNGGLRFINVSTVMYRQHSNNVVGGINRGTFNRIKNIKVNLNNLKNDVKKTRNYLNNYKGLYYSDRCFNDNKDKFKFAVTEVLPCSFKGKKKIKNFVVFLLFLKY